MTDTTEPIQVQKLARDITPYYHGIWCSVGGGEPFVNAIELRRWSNDGKHIVFMLGTHNFLKAAPDELIDVVELQPSAPAGARQHWAEHDALRMAEKPTECTCPTCGGTGKTMQRPRKK